MRYSNVLRAVLVGLLVLSGEMAWGQCPAITLTPSSLAAGQQAAVYGPVLFTATGGTTPRAFSATGLPTGTSISATGVLSGTPSVSGTFAVRITARDARSCLGRRLISWVINPGVAPTITSAATTGFIVGQSNTFTVTTTGTPTPTLTLSGDALPSGVTFVPSTGILSGTPASGTGGTYNLVFTAANGILPDASQNFTLTVNQRPSVSGGPLSVPENSSNSTTVGAVAVADPHTPAQTHSWSITAGNTGTAFAIDSSGVLTVANSTVLDFETTPSFSLTVQATDNGTPVLSGSALITINLSNVNEGPTAVADSTTVAEGGTVTMLTTPAGATSVRDNDSDPDDALAALTVTLSAAPTNASAFTLNTDGTFSYTHDGSETTTDSFLYQLCDPAPVPLCATATVFVTITAGNDAPVLTAGGTLAYTENDPATAIDTTMTVSDADDAVLTGATIQLTSNYQNGQDVLACGACGALSATFVAGTGTLTLTGSETLATYEAALRSVTYVNTSDTPNTTNRTVTWIGNDGTDASASVTSTITVTAANDPPVLTAGGTLNYTENQVAQVVDGTVTVTDPDDTNLESATVQITSNYQNGSDVLACGSCGGIGAVFTPATGTLTLTGTASEAAYQAALRSVTYVNTSENPTMASRTVTWLGNDGTDTSVAVTSTITVTAVNDAPVLTAGSMLAYTENDLATAIDTTVTVSDVDHANLTGATIQITSNYQNGQDVLSFANMASISGSFAAGSGTLTLTGADTVANYQAALRTVRYANSSENPNTANRTVTWQVNDGGGVNNLSNTPTSTITVTSVNDPPVIASPPSYVVHTNIAMDVADGAGDLLDVGITDVDSAGPFTLGTVPSTATGTGGTLGINANGSFHYNPGLNLTGAGTFVYQVCDSGNPLPVACANVTATVNVSGLAIVFVDDSAAGGGDGTLEEPLQTLAAGLAALDSPSAGSAVNVFLFSGNYGQTAVRTLVNNVRVFGQGSTVADFETLYGITPPETAPVNSINRPALSQARPVVSSTTGCLALALGGSNTLRGFEIGSCAGDALASTGANFGTLTVPSDNMVINNTSGRALNLTNGTLTATFSSITSTGGTNNINLNTIVGTSTLGGGALSGATGTAFNVSGGTATLSYSGTIAQESVGQRVVDVTNHSTGTLTLSGAITASNGTGLGFNNADGTYTLSGVVTLNGGDAGIDVSGGSAGLITLANTGSVVTNPSGIAVDIDGSSASFSFSFAGNITKTNNATTAIDVTNNTNGTISFTGTSKTLSTSTATAVNLATNTGSTIGFSNGGVAITTTSGTGFNATGGAAAINVTGAGNTITSTTGTALNVANSTIGGSGLTFQSISAGTGAGGPTNGIVLNTTGGLGGLTVTGTGGAGTGGTIQNSTGPGVSLISTRAIGLSSMNIVSGGDDGIRGSTVTGLSLTGVQVTSNGNAATEAGIDLTNLLGTSTWSSVTVSGSAEDNVVIRNSSGTLTSLTVTASAFSNNSAIGNDGFLMEASGTASMTASLTGNTFAAHRGDHFQAAAANSGILDVIFSSNTLAGGHATALGQGITISAATGVAFGGYTGTVNYDIDNNVINGSILSSITVNLGTSGAAGTFNGFVRNNDIGTAGQALSCSAQAHGIAVDAHGNGTHTVAVTDNLIRRCKDRGIGVLANDGNGNLNLTVTGNTITEMVDDDVVNGTPREAIELNLGATTTNVFGQIDSHTICLALGGAGALRNSLIGGTFKNGDIRLRQRFRTGVVLPGYTPPGGNNFDTASVITFLQGNNLPAGVTATATTNNDAGVTTDGYFGGASCPTPP